MGNGLPWLCQGLGDVGGAPSWILAGQKQSYKAITVSFIRPIQTQERLTEKAYRGLSVREKFGQKFLII